MIHVDRLEMIENPVCDVHVGKFSYIDATGETYEAEFFVRVPQDNPLDDRVKAERVEAYNEQLTEEYDDLSARGCTEIKYTEDIPIQLF
jgi:hypothetical protein